MVIGIDLDDKYRILLNDDKSYILKCFWKNDVFKEIKIKESNRYKNINDLLKK